MKRKTTRRSWDDVEREALWRIKQESNCKTLKGVARKLAKDLGLPIRTTLALSHELRKIRERMEGDFESQQESLQGEAKSTQREQVIYHEGIGGLYAQLAAYDQNNLLEIFEGRQKIIHNTLCEQAKQIEAYDLTTAYKKCTAEELIQIMGSDLAKREVILALFSDESETKSATLGTIELLALPGEGLLRNELGLILPVYKDLTETSVRSLGSALKDAVFATFSGNGFSKPHSKQRVEGFGRLLKLYFTELERGQYDFANLGSAISDLVNEEFHGGLEVAIAEDPLLYRRND